MNNVTYNKAVKHDLDEIVNLSLVLNKLNKEDIYAKKVFLNKIIDGGLAWVAKYEEKLIGFICCELFDGGHHNFPNSVFISELFVDERYRRQGVGKKLMEVVLSSLYPLEYTYFSITHDPGEEKLTDFYTSFGFEEVGTTKAGNVKMIKQR